MYIPIQFFMLIRTIQLDLFNSEQVKIYGDPTQ